MDQPSAVDFTAFTDVWPRVNEMEIDAALCAVGARGALTSFYVFHNNVNVFLERENSPLLFLCVRLKCLLSVPSPTLY